MLYMGHLVVLYGRNNDSDSAVPHIDRVGYASDRTTLAPFHSPTIASFLTNLARAIARFN